MNLIFATHNANKATEIQNALPLGFKIQTLSDIGYLSEIPETGSTLEQNAKIKALTIFQKFNLPCFADDTGLEVAALNGAPGVFSARFAGDNATYLNNCNLLLAKMEGILDRRAAFRSIFCYINKNAETFYFEGIINGKIATEPKGSKGFGYDSVFIPDGQKRTFAEMEMAEKNKISHRNMALQKLVHFLSEQGS